jgi:hypothetical protein
MVKGMGETEFKGREKNVITGKTNDNSERIRKWRMSIVWCK